MFKKVTKESIKHICKKIIIPALQSAIRGYLFRDSRYGAPLKPSTIKAKQRKGSTTPHMPLRDTGALSGQLSYKMVSGGEGRVSSSGQTEQIQKYLYKGTSKMPARNLMNIDLPSGGGLTIENMSIVYYAGKLVSTANAEIGKICKTIK